MLERHACGNRSTAPSQRHACATKSVIVDYRLGIEFFRSQNEAGIAMRT
jgi:hypothetical protein